MSTGTVSDAHRQHYEQARLRRAITLLQVLVGVLGLVVAGLVFSLTQVEDRLLENASELHLLRESIQKGLGDFEPKVDQVIKKLDVASGKADTLDRSLGNAEGFDARVDSAIGRANAEIPRSIERFFQEKGATVIANAIQQKPVQDAANAKATDALKHALDDPSVGRKAEDVASKALDSAFNNLGKKKSTSPAAQ